MSGTALIRRIPDVGETFTITDRWSKQRYRVEGWLKRTPSPHRPSIATECGPDRVRLMFCLRDEAEYVHGYGVCGCIVRIDDVVVDGKVSWPESEIEQMRLSAILFAGQYLY
jgi:hypothetical protein